MSATSADGRGVSPEETEGGVVASAPAQTHGSRDDAAGSAGAAAGAARTGLLKASDPCFDAHHPSWRTMEVAPEQLEGGVVTDIGVGFNAADALVFESTADGSSSQSTSEANVSSPSALSPSLEKRQTAPPHRWRRWSNEVAAWMYPLSSRDGKGGGGGTPRLEALDAPRWIASIQIVCYHMYAHKPGFERYSTWFAVWTQLFFLLSGFVLAYAELAKPPKSRLSLLRYVRRRLTVIYPAFFLSLLLKVAYAPGRSAFEWAMLPLHALLMQSWIPMCTKTDPGGISCAPWLYNGEAWFLSVLVIFWMFLRPLAEFFRRRGPAFCGCTLLCCWAWSLVFQWAGDHNRLAHILGCSGGVCPLTIMVAIRAGPLGYAHVFVAGVAAARIFMLLAMRDADTRGRIGVDTTRVVFSEADAPFVLRFGCCLGYLLYACVVLLGTRWITPYYYFFHNGGMLPIMVLVLIGAAIGTDPITTWVFRSRPMLLLGRISYLQYLMQHVLQGWMQLTFGWEHNSTAQALFIPALLVFSYACQRWVERPYTEYQRWRLEKGIKGCDDRCIEFLEGIGARFAGTKLRRGVAMH